MGGMTGFGPVHREDDEPVFHANWERRVLALCNAAMGYVGPPDRLRHAIERMGAVEYLTTSYYEHWLAALEMLLQELGYATAEELASGRAVDIPKLSPPPPSPDMVEGFIRMGAPTSRDEGRLEPAFNVGDRVRARNMTVAGHTRLARYVRGKTGVITDFHGAHVFPDTVAHDLGENAQPLYTVRFEARELWGDNIERRDCVHIELWEDYLEPAGKAERGA